MEEGRTFANQEQPRREALASLREKPTTPIHGSELSGYVVWGIVGAFIAIPEILAALSKTLKNGIPWPTISATVGHLESRWDIVAVLVVALIVIVAARVVVQPPTRNATGRTKAQR